MSAVGDARKRLDARPHWDPAVVTLIERARAEGRAEVEAEHNRVLSPDEAVTLLLAERAPEPSADATERAAWVAGSTSGWHAGIGHALAEVERRIEALRTTRTQAWAKGWDSISLADALSAIYETRAALAPAPGEGEDS